MSILLTRKELAEALAVDVRSISNFQNEGLPVYRKEGEGRANLYNSAECIWWFMERKAAQVGRPIKAEAYREHIEGLRDHARRIEAELRELKGLGAPQAGEVVV